MLIYYEQIMELITFLIKICLLPKLQRQSYKINFKQEQIGTLTVNYRNFDQDL